MDRSVDSIGSCSLDVDADSTDFSDTSGSLNLATPSSGKDIPREFTSRIKERCQITTQTQINFNSFHQQTSAILDPNSGKISTTLVSTSPCTRIIDSPTSSPAKKPSYLNLACCVNGYSNLTTYDSKLRQNINKSREVSPIRPSTNNNLPSSQQTHRLSGNFLAVPLTSSYASRSPSSSPSSKGSGLGSETTNNTTITMENRHIFSQVHGVDTTDNVGNDLYFKSTKFISSPNHLKGGDLHENDASNTTKSFIQQRVERLYGPGALAQGFYSPKKTKSPEISILSERSSNSQVKFTSSKTITTFEREITSSSTTLNGKTTMVSSSSLERTSTISPGTGDENCENIQNGGGGAFTCDLPVLRHLRPEFRAQLPIMSPKRSPNKYSLNETSSCPVLQNGTNGAAYINGTAAANGNANLTVNGKAETKAPRCINDTATSPTKYSNCSIFINNNNISTLESKVITTSSTPAAVVHIDKKSLDSEIPLETHSQKISSSRECDRISLSSLTTQQPSVYVVTSKMPKSEAPATAVATIDIAVSSIGGGGGGVAVDHDVPDRAAVAEPMPVSAAPLHADTHSEDNSCATSNDIVMRDAHYFIRILKTEQTRLLQLADQVEKELETLLAVGAPALSAEAMDDVLGYLRSAAGKARLLVSQKMKQFEGLCINNLNQSPDEKFPTTVEDLQGFWDMVMLQVTHVDNLFKEIETLKANNWKKPAQPVPSAPQGSKLTRRPNTTKPSSSMPATNGSSTSNGTSAATKKSNAASLAAAQRREAQRKQLLELKRKHKMAMASGEQQDQQQQQSTPNQVVEIFVNELQPTSS